MSVIHQKLNGTLPTDLTKKVAIELLDTAGLGVRSVGPVGVFLDLNVCLFWGY